MLDVEDQKDNVKKENNTDDCDHIQMNCIEYTDNNIKDD